MRIQVDEPEILMLNLSAQQNECPSSRQKGEAACSASQGESRQGMQCGLGGDGLHRKGGADVRARVDREAAVGRPYGIDRIFMDKKRGGAAVEGYAK